MRRTIVHGLTTAASLWAVAAIGLAVGGGLYVAAAAATVVVLVILVIIKPIERRYFTHRRPRTLVIQVERKEISILALETTVEEAELKIRSIVIEPSEDGGKDSVQLLLDRVATKKLVPLIEKLREMPGVLEIRHDTE
ncbi:MAG: MgtC family protein [Acidobacteria bacterium OLB17]|nr:MAG: MgtC family protein [Acidobacteria bacterium OLB17]